MTQEQSEMEAKLRKLQILITMPNDLEYFGDAVLPKDFVGIKERIEEFEVRETDIWIISFPRAGGMFLQEMVWLLLNNFNYKRAATEPLHERCGHLEYNAVEPPKIKKVAKSGDVIVQLIGLTTRRFIVTYLPWTLLPREIKDGAKKPKILYIMRELEDVLVSYHEFYDLFLEENITLEIFFKLFITNNYVYTPYWANLLSYWRMRDRENVLILRYNDLMDDMKSTIMQVSRYIGATVPDNQMSQLISHLSYEAFSKNDSINRGRLLRALYPKNPKKQSIFVENEQLQPPRRKLTPEQLAMLDFWSKKNTKDSDLDYRKLSVKK